MKRVLVLGGTGMLGHKLVQVFGRRFDTFTTIRRPFEYVRGFQIFDEDRTLSGVDVTDLDRLRMTIERVEPDVVVNAVGVIKQLDIAGDLNYLSQVNILLPNELSILANDLGFRLIGISTDCVFSGSRGNYSEEDEPDPVDPYGRTKVLSESTDGNCLTIRTSIIGRELDTGHSLIEWFLSNRGGSVSGFTGAIYTGFPTIVLADILTMVISDHPELNGLYHVSSEPISKFDLLRLVNDVYGAEIEILPNDRLEIDRSLNSTRFRKATGFEPDPWHEMIRRMAADPTPYDKYHRTH